VDGDVPDKTNLHRQVFFSEVKTQKTKSQVLAEHISELNSDIELIVIPEMISKSNTEDVIKGADLVLECTDNIQAKYLVNDYCHVNQIPMVYGAIHKYDGFVSFFENESPDSIHLRDIFAEPSDDIPSCSEVGVVGTLAGLVGLMQANEAIKYITGAGQCLIGRLLSYDILSNNQLKLNLQKTYREDMKYLYAETVYDVDLSCDIQEVSYGELMQFRDRYELISILEDHEHSSIDEEVTRQPLSKFDYDNWKPLSNKPHVFYCMSGKRSSALVQKLNSQVETISLAGGLLSINA